MPKHPLFFVLTIFLPGSFAGAATISNSNATPPPTNASVAISLTTSATVTEDLSLSLTDGVGATSGGATCLNVTAASSLVPTGSNGTSNLGSYDTDLAAGTPSGAQGCPTVNGVAAVQTFQLSTITPRAASVTASVISGSTWDAVAFATGSGNDWTQPSTGTVLGTSAATVIPSISSGESSQNVQVAWTVNIGSTSGAKSGTMNLTLVAP